MPAFRLRRLVRGTAVAMALVVAPAAADPTTQRDVRGVVTPESAATISSDLNARVVAMPFRTGQSFRRGDDLLRFDCGRYEADLRAAEAEVKTQAITMATHRQLLRHNATGTNDLALAEAKHAQAVASAESLRLRTSQCVIKAPYDGRVVERSVDVHEMPQANSSLMRIVKDGALEIDLIVPSSWAVWLQPGHPFVFKVDETATEYRAKLLNLGAVVDPVSRTMKLTASLMEPGHLVRPGMSGTARIVPPERR